MCMDELNSVINEVMISKENISHFIKKKDVILAFTKTNRCFVCELNGVKEDSNFYILKPATKDKGE